MGNHLFLRLRQFLPDISKQFRIIFFDLFGYRIAFHRGFRKHRIHHLLKGGHTAAKDQIYDGNALRNRHAGISDHKSIFMAERRYMTDQLRI